MKTCYLVLGLIAVVAADSYDSKYDSFDIEPLIYNDRVLTSFTNCFLDKGPCSPDAKNFKKIIPEALQTTCGKCSPKQEQLIRKVVKVIIQKHPDAWEELTNKYDEEKKHKESFEKFLRAE